MSAPYVCGECGRHQHEVDMGVLTTLCSVSGDDTDYTVTESAFKSWYCFDCFPPDE